MAAAARRRACSMPCVQAAGAAAAPAPAQRRLRPAAHARTPLRVFCTLLTLGR